MEQNVGAQERLPRIAMALAAAIGATGTRSNVLKSALLAVSAGLLSTVAIGYCPVSAVFGRDTAEEPHWRTLRSWRVEAPTT